jgi:hypothetical protein
MGRPNLSVSHHRHQKQQQERRAASAPAGAAGAAHALAAPAPHAAPQPQEPQLQPQGTDVFDEQALDAMVHCAPNTSTTLVSAGASMPANGQTETAEAAAAEAPEPPTDPAEDEGTMDDHPAAETDELEEDAAAALPGATVVGSPGTSSGDGDDGGGGGGGGGDGSEAAPTPAAEEPHVGEWLGLEVQSACMGTAMQPPCRMWVAAG